MASSHGAYNSKKFCKPAIWSNSPAKAAIRRGWHGCLRWQKVFFARICPGPTRPGINMRLPEINTIAILGAGTMGRGIAYASCMAGNQTKLYDVADESLTQAGNYVMASFQKAVGKGVVTDASAAQAFSRLQTTTVFENAVNFADFVIEAVPEKIDMKIDL